MINLVMIMLIKTETMAIQKYMLDLLLVLLYHILGHMISVIKTMIQEQGLGILLDQQEQKILLSILI